LHMHTSCLFNQTYSNRGSPDRLSVLSDRFSRTVYGRTKALMMAQTASSSSSSSSSSSARLKLTSL
jgi:hypothetical protein